MTLSFATGWKLEDCRDDIPPETGFLAKEDRTIVITISFIESLDSSNVSFKNVFQTRLQEEHVDLGIGNSTIQACLRLLQFHLVYRKKRIGSHWTKYLSDKQKAN